MPRSHATVIRGVVGRWLNGAAHHARARTTSVHVALGGASPVVKPPEGLFQTNLATGTNVLGNKPQYAVARDGRFLLNTAIEGPTAPIAVAVNWMKK